MEAALEKAVVPAGDVKNRHVDFIGLVAVARSENRQSMKHPVTAHYRVKTVEYGELIERIKGRERRFGPWKFSHALDSLVP
jgi:hypothetical protein